MATLDRTKAPDFKLFEKFDIKEVNSLKLDNNVTLYYVNAGDQPVARLELIFNAGSWYESKVGQAYFAGKMLKEGTDKNDSQAISLLFDQYGAFLEISPGLDQLSVTVYGLTKHFPVLVPFIRELIFDSTFPEKELNTLKNITIQDIKVQNKKNNVLASKLFRTTLFGKGHPYGIHLEETAINDLRPEHLSAFHRSNVVGNFQIILSGKVNEAEIRLVEETFGNVSLTDTTESKPEYSLHGKPGQQSINKTDSLQSSIRLGKILFPKKTP